MKHLCSWCGAVVVVGSTPDAQITHTICERCIAKIEDEMAESERRKALPKQQE